MTRRRRTIPHALLRLQPLRIFASPVASRPPRGFVRAVRRLRETFIGVLPGAADIEAANESGK